MFYLKLRGFEVSLQVSMARVKRAFQNLREGRLEGGQDQGNSQEDELAHSLKRL